MSVAPELDDRVRAMFQEKLALGVPCLNQDCELKATCERFYDQLRTENRDKPDVGSLIVYNPDRDDCFVLRRRLQGTPEVHREWTKTTNRHRRRGGKW